MGPATCFWSRARTGLVCGLLSGSACVWEVELDSEFRSESTRIERSQPKALSGVSSLLQPLFGALSGAVEDGDEALAETILTRLRACSLTTAEESLANAFERVLTGRRLVAQLELSLSSEPLTDDKYRLVLAVENTAHEVLTLRLPPADLTRFRLGVNAEGNERSEYDNRVVRVLSGLELEAGARREFDLLEYGLAVGELLAVRERWQLRARSGEILFRGEAYPAASVPVAPCERVRLREDGAQKPVEPEELARLLDTEDTLETAVLLEHAVRVRPEDRDLALKNVAPYIQRWLHTEPDRIQAAAPALRWLSHNTRLGGEAQAWNRYLQERLRPKYERPVLDLPNKPQVNPTHD